MRAAIDHSSDGDLRLVLRAVRGVRSAKLNEVVETAYRERSLTDATGRSSLPELTARETEILALMAEGKRNTEMARELFISIPTVKTHVNHIYTKLGVSSRVQAVLVYKKSSPV